MAIAAILMGLALALGEAQASPPAVVDMAAFDAAVQAGQAQYFAGEYLTAARTWRDAARQVPLAPEQRGDVVMIHGYLADAYDKASERTDDPAVLREALAVLDEHAVQFAAAYPGEPLLPRIEAIRGRLRERLVASEGRAGAERAEPIVMTYREARPTVKPWRGLAIGGGAALAGGAAMTVVMLVGLAGTKEYETSLQGGGLTCQINAIDGCAKNYGDYRTASSMLLTGLLAAPVLIGAGAAMVVAAVKRKRAAQQPGVMPMFGRGFVGLGWQRRF